MTSVAPEKHEANIQTDGLRRCRCPENEGQSAGSLNNVNWCS